MERQETPLPQRDRATRCVSSNLVSCCTDVRKITFERLAVGMTLKVTKLSALPLFDTPYIASY